MNKILIVEDDLDVVEVLSFAIEKCGYEPVLSKTLNHALQLSSQYYLEAVLLDASLPDGNGIDFIPRFRNLSSIPEVVIITGQGAPNKAERAFDQGAFDFIQKPVSISHIALTIMQIKEYRTAMYNRSSPRDLSN